MREHLIQYFSDEIRSHLISTNKAWDVRRVEAPTLVPAELISNAYTNSDVWMQECLSDNELVMVLRPETTSSSYVYMQHILSNHSKTRLPLCVWQAGKSYRREQDQPVRHVRLKEFWQQEFQCAYSADSGNDYYSNSLEFIRHMIGSVIHLPTRLVPSDRLPTYSQITMDIEVDNGDKWMEICSISKRTDFPGPTKPQRRGAAAEQEVVVLEIAIGLDRCIYNWLIACNG